MIESIYLATVMQATTNVPTMAFALLCQAMGLGLIIYVIIRLLAYVVCDFINKVNSL